MKRLTDDEIIARLREIEPNLTKLSEEHIRKELKFGFYKEFSIRFTKYPGQVPVSPATIRNMKSLEDIQRYVECNCGGGEDCVWIFPSIVKRETSLERIKRDIAVKEDLKKFWEEGLREEIELRQKEWRKK